MDDWRLAGMKIEHAAGNVFGDFDFLRPGNWKIFLLMQPLEQRASVTEFRNNVEIILMVTDSHQCYEVIMRSHLHQRCNLALKLFTAIFLNASRV